MGIRTPSRHLSHPRPEDGGPPPADPPPALNSPGHTSRIGARGCPDRFEARPRRLGHVLLFSGDLERMIDFYTRVLGMKLSDRCPGIIAFLRCTPDHHNLALLASK